MPSRLLRAVERHLHLADPERASLGTAFNVRVDVEDQGVAAEIHEALSERGHGVATPDASTPTPDGWPAAVVDVPTGSWTDRVPARVRAARESLAPSGLLVLLVPGGVEGQSAEQLAEALVPRLRLGRGRGERVAVGDGTADVVGGQARPALGSSERKRLRGLGHGLEPTILVGRAGLTDELVAAAADAVARHGLVKAKLTPQCELDKDEVAVELGWATCSVVAQRVGKTVLLYRPDVPLDPPQKRSGRR